MKWQSVNLTLNLVLCDSVARCVCTCVNVLNYTCAYSRWKCCCITVCSNILHMCCTCVNVLNYPCAVMFVGNCFSTPCWRNVAHVLHMCCTCVSVLKYPCAREKLKEIPGKWLPGSRKMQKMISRFPENNIFCTWVHVICTCAHVNAHVPYMWIHVHMCRTFLYMGILTSPRLLALLLVRISHVR